MFTSHTPRTVQNAFFLPLLAHICLRAELSTYLVLLCDRRKSRRYFVVITEQLDAGRLFVNRSHFLVSFRHSECRRERSILQYCYENCAGGKFNFQFLGKISECWCRFSYVESKETVNLNRKKRGIHRLSHQRKNMYPVSEKELSNH
ncbi:hypothetical protein WA026_020999 [Henosepilachna vigintioctopunctata]|uniref:Secreted protein n=1 Tax=Henosepilachna vigintioctopunctata TaxID=420089 RepID=A0AAW1VI63_9CUCU